MYFFSVSWLGREFRHLGVRKGRFLEVCIDSRSAHAIGRIIMSVSQEEYNNDNVIKNSTFDFHVKGIPNETEKEPLRNKV